MIAPSVNVKLHPPVAQLQQFVAGELSPGLSVALSAHIECCDQCQLASTALEAEAVAAWDETPANDENFALSALLANIVDQPQIKIAEVTNKIPQSIEVENQSFAVPRVLAKAAAEGLSWKRLGGGISQATVAIDDCTKCEFIYMAPGSKAPVHTHRGNEVTLVLDGSFSDELGEYNAADFVVRDPNHKHQPRTEKGCLCFSVLDSPLVFTSGFLRLLNPLNRLMFHKAQWFR